LQGAPLIVTCEGTSLLGVAGTVAAPLWADAACDEKINPPNATTVPSDRRIEPGRRESTVADGMPGSASANSP
jgi:hypothetical protein